MRLANDGEMCIAYNVIHHLYATKELPFESKSFSLKQDVGQKLSFYFIIFLYSFNSFNVLLEFLLEYSLSIGKKIVDIELKKSSSSELAKFRK
jgi:hypothetical protein